MSLEFPSFPSGAVTVPEDEELIPNDTYEPTLEEQEAVRFEPGPLQLEKRGVTSQIHQRELWEKESHHHAAVVAKLDSAGYKDLADLTRECHTLKSFRRCRGCGDATVFFNRCDLKWCPICTPRLGRERKDSVEWWTKLINQPKHVVLTQRNFEILTKSAVKKFKHNFNRLRRTKFCTQRTVRLGKQGKTYVSWPWKGGFYSLEVTNDGQNGWHLHLHALVDSQFVDAFALSQLWAKLIGQTNSIVHVSDCSDKDFLREVTKYAVKGSQLAAWDGNLTAQFILAFDGVRTFGVFGTLYGKRAEFRDFIQSIRDYKPVCTCGCNLWEILTDKEFEWRNLTVGGNAPPRLEVSSPQKLMAFAD